MVVTIVGFGRFRWSVSLAGTRRRHLGEPATFVSFEDEDGLRMSLSQDHAALPAFSSLASSGRG
jgi:hypothetical protein